MASTKATGPTVGLDIGTAYIKAVEMRPGRGRSHVAAIGIAPTPPNTVTPDGIIDPVTLGAAIKRLLQESGISAKKVVASVTSMTNFVLRILPVPTMTDKELVEAMRWEVERHVPFRPEDTIKDYVRLPSLNGNGDAAEMPVLLVVGQKGLIDSYTSALLFAGLTPAALDVEPLSLLRTAPLSEIREGCVAMVNVGATKTDIGIFDRGVLVYPRSVPMAGNNFTRAVADTLGLPTEQAERLKVEYGEIPENRVAAASPFDQGGGFGAFDDFGAPAADPFAAPAVDTFGASATDDALDFDAPLTDPLADPVADEPIGGFAAPLDDPIDTAPADAGPADAGPGGFAFSLEDDDDVAAPPAPAPGGFSFSLEDDDPPAATTPAPPDEPATGGTAFAFDDDDDLLATPAEPAGGAAPSFAFDDDDTPPATPSAPAAAFADDPADAFGDLDGGTAASAPAAATGTISEAPVPLTQDELRRRQVSDALVPVYNDLSQDIRRTLDVYANRPEGRAVQRVYLSGGTARLRGFAHALEQDLGIPVQLEDPSRNFSLAGRNAAPGYYAEVGPVVALAIGLGARDHVPDPTPTAAASAKATAKAGKKK